MTFIEWWNDGQVPDLHTWQNALLLFWFGGHFSCMMNKVLRRMVPRGLMCGGTICKGSLQRQNGNLACCQSRDWGTMLGNLSQWAQNFRRIPNVVSREEAMQRPRLRDSKKVAVSSALIARCCGFEKRLSRQGFWPVRKNQSRITSRALKRCGTVREVRRSACRIGALSFSTLVVFLRIQTFW